MLQEYSAKMKMKAKGRDVTLKLKVDSFEDLKLLMDNEHIMLQSLEHIFVGGKGVKRPRRTKKTSGGKTMSQEIHEVFTTNKMNEMSVKDIQNLLEDRGTYFGTSNHYVAIYTTLTQSDEFEKVKDKKATFRRL